MNRAANLLIDSCRPDRILAGTSSRKGFRACPQPGLTGRLDKKPMDLEIVA